MQLAREALALLVLRAQLRGREEPRVLDRDRNLVGHGREEGDVVEGGLTTRPAIDVQRSDRGITPDEGDRHERVPLEAEKVFV